MKYSDIMLDIETMSTKTNAAIVSIGAVGFNVIKNEVYKENTFYAELNWQDQDFDYDRHIDPDTVAWWEKQSKEARKSLNGTKDLRESLLSLSEWVLLNGSQTVKVWANAPSFDCVIVKSAMDQCGIAHPWKFWNEMDCRTIQHMFFTARGQLRADKRHVKHNALDDAIDQATRVNHQWAHFMRR